MTAVDPPWLPPPANLAWSRAEVHVWRAALDLTAARVQSLHLLLAADERARAARFSFPQDRARFVVARAVLRVILSRYLDRAPGQLRFGYSAYGKPALITTPGEAALSFNLSHSAELALYAVTWGRAIGVDVESIRPNLDHEQMAERFFSARERALLRRLPAELKRAAFFTCWTRKEAYLKASGEGLSLALDQFDVSVDPGEPARLLDSRRDPHAAARWSLQDLVPGAHYAAALAVEGHDWQLRCWQWLD